MKRIFTYIILGLAIIAGFCLAFTIVVVLVAKDHDGLHNVSEKWMPYISLILIVAIPAVAVWGIFRLMRKFFFRKIRKEEMEKRA